MGFVNNYEDFIKFHAQQAGMTREEWIAHYGVAEGNAKPGPDAYMTGLSDDEEEKKKEKMKKQAEMDDDDPDAYKELPGDKEAREEGKVKKSKHVTAYHKLYGEDLDESTMSDIHQMAGEAKSKEDFLKMFFKEYGAKVKKTKDSEEWAASLYDDMNESKITEKSVYFYQDKVETLVKGLDREELEVFAFDNDVDLSDEESMGNFIGSLDKKDAKAIIKQLVGENLNEMAMGYDAMTGLFYIEGVPFTKERLEQSLKYLRTKLKLGNLPKQFDYYPALQVADNTGMEIVTLDLQDAKKLEDALKRFKGKLASDADFNESNQVSEAEHSGSEASDKMAFSQLERIIDYATMIRDRMAAGKGLDAWMYGKVIKAEDYLNTLFDVIDGDDGVVETQQMTKKEWKKIKKFNKHVTDSGEKFVMNYNDMIGTFLEPVEIVDEAIEESVVTEGKLKISGAAYDLWDEKEVQRKLKGVKIKIVGDIGGVATISGSDDELQKVKDILGLNESVVNEEKAEGDRGPIDNPDIETALKKKADDTGVPIGLIRIVMRRGMAAWKTGHRPGAGQEQWGYARVNSFLTKQPGTWGDADSDVAKEVRDGGHDSKLKKA